VTEHHLRTRWDYGTRAAKTNRCGRSNDAPVPFFPVFSTYSVLLLRFLRLHLLRTPPAGTLPLIGPSTPDAAGHCPEPRSLIGSGHLTGPATTTAQTNNSTTTTTTHCRSSRAHLLRPVLHYRSGPVLPGRNLFTTRSWSTARGHQPRPVP